MKLSGKVFSKILAFSFGFALFFMVAEPSYAMSKRNMPSTEKTTEKSGNNRKNKNKNKTEKEPVKVTETPVTAEEGQSEGGTRLIVPKKKNSYFSKIDETVLSGIENGSPESIKAALSSIYKNKNPEDSYSEAEKVLVNIGCFVMNTVWPSENFSFDCPEVETENPYIGALGFVERGFFDSSTGNTDFLTSILPCLVILQDEEHSSLVYSQVEVALAKAREYRSESFLADYLQAVYFLRKGSAEAAEPVFEKLIQMSPNVDVKCAYAQNLYLLKKYNQAFEVASALLQSNPSSINFLKMNARIAFEMKAYDQAEEYVARVLQQNPNSLEFLLFRAKILMAKKDEVHAASILDMYARMNDTNEEYLYLRGKLQLDWLKKTADATETVEKGLSLYEDSVNLLLLAARIASITDAPVAGRYADELVSAILEDDPENQDALTYSLDALIRRSLWQEAYEVSSRLVNVSSEVEPLPENIMKHVEICLELDKVAEASRIATASYENNPSNDYIVMAYVLTQVNSGSINQSITLINSLLETPSKELKSFLYYRRSLLQATESASMADLRNSLLAEPKNCDSLFRLYEIYYAKSDYKKAQYYLRQVVLNNPNNVTYRNLNESLSKLVK